MFCNLCSGRKELKTIEEKTGFEYVSQSGRLHHILSDPSSKDGIDFFFQLTFY